jgi:hypothetical protein
VHARVAVGAGAGIDALYEPSVGSASDLSAWRHVLVAYAGYTAPVRGRPTLDAGVFPSHIGYESFPTRENWNYSHAWMADLSPYYQAGVRFTYGITSRVQAQLLWLNGWNPVEQDHAFRSGGAQVQYASDRFKATVNAFVGPVRAVDRAGDRSVRYFVDAWAQIAPIPQLAAAAVVDAGLDERPASMPRSDGRGFDRWYAVGGYLRYAPIERLAFAVRTDLFLDDDSGLLTGTPQRLAEATITASLTLGIVLLRGEVRIDHATQPTLDGETDRRLYILSASASF